MTTLMNYPDKNTDRIRYFFSGMEECSRTEKSAEAQAIINQLTLDHLTTRLFLFLCLLQS